MKHLRKNGGYVLVYVLVVFAIVSFAAVSICATALGNLQAQQADVARTEARYEAERYLQRFQAETEALRAATPHQEYLSSDAAKADAEALFWNSVEETAASIAADAGMDLLTVTVDEAADTVTARAKDSGKTVCIGATVQMTLECETEEHPQDVGEGQEPVSCWAATCALKSGGWQYIRYDISYGEVPDETQ